jgi:hypothetical protein
MVFSHVQRNPKRTSIQAGGCNIKTHAGNTKHWVQSNLDKPDNQTKLTSIDQCSLHLVICMIECSLGLGFYGNDHVSSGIALLFT